MITVTLQLQNAAQLAFLSAALDRMDAEASGITETPVEDKPAKKAKPVTVAAVVEPEPEPAPVPTLEREFTLEQVRAKLGELTQAGKKEGVKGLLAMFGAAKLTDLDPAKYAEVMNVAGGL